MINPWQTHGPMTGTVTRNDADHIAQCEIKSGGTTYSGYDMPKGIKVGEKVTFHVQFSIMSDRYTIVKGSVRRKRKPKPSIQVVDKYTDSFGTLHVKFIGHDGQLKQVYFDEGDHWMFGNLNKESA